jgi:purine-binding chemotaxis protein CheW
MTQQLLIVTLASRRVAVRSVDVESLIELDTLVPVPGAAPHIAGLSALRSRMLTVIDSALALGLCCGKTPAAKQPAMVIEHEGHFFALMVDAIEDFTQALSDPQRVDADLGQGWKQASLGVVETAQGPLLLVDVAAIIDGIPLQRAA